MLLTRLSLLTDVVQLNPAFYNDSAVYLCRRKAVIQAIPVYTCAHPVYVGADDRMWMKGWWVGLYQTAGDWQLLHLHPWFLIYQFVSTLSVVSFVHAKGQQKSWDDVGASAEIRSWNISLRILMSLHGFHLILQIVFNFKIPQVFGGLGGNSWGDSDRSEALNSWVTNYHLRFSLYWSIWGHSFDSSPVTMIASCTLTA